MRKIFAENFLSILLTITLAAAPATALAVGGDVIWQATDTRAAKQEAAAMAVDSAGNVIVAGYTVASGNDYQLVKFKADGSGLSWSPVTFGGAGDDAATAVAVDSSDNIIVTGYSWNGSNYDIHTIKYNGADGSVLWQDTFAGAAGGNDFATAIAVDHSDNIYVAGYSPNAAGNDDFLILKYASGGSTPLWQEIYDSSYHSHDRITAIAAGPDGIAVTGYSSKAGADFDILTRKYGFDKALIREWRHSSSGSQDDRGVAVRMDSSGYLLVTGFVSDTTNKEIYTVKYDPASDAPVWERSYSGPNNDEPKALWVDGGGDVYITGYTATYSGNEDFYTARYRGSDGFLLWEAVYDSGNGNSDIPAGIVVDNAADGGVFVTGHSVTAANEDFLTVKYRKDNGVLLWEKSWNGSGNKNDRPVGIGLASRNVCVAGWTDGGGSSYDFQAVKYDFGPINPPTGLTATADSNISITLDWIDNSSNEDGFRIERKLGEGGAYSEIAVLPPGTITYPDTGLTSNSYYYYRVRAYNAANGNSSWSNEARVLTKVVTYDPPTGSYLYNGADGRADEAVAITVGTDDHPVVTGYSDLSEEGVEDAYSFDYVTIKLDRANMGIKWKARYDSGDGGTDIAAGVAIDGNNDAIVTGTAYLMGASDKSDDLYTIKYSSASHNDPDTNPPMAWDHQYGTQAGIDQATAIQTAIDGSNKSVVVGYGRNASNNDDIFIIKYNPDGTRPWTPIVYDSGRNDYPEAVALDGSGNIFVTGFTESAGGTWNWFTAKYDGATGALVWSDTFDGGFGDDQAYSIAVDASGNAYVAGYVTNASGNSDLYVMKYDGAASPVKRRIWEKSYDGPFHGDDEAVAVRIDPIDGAVVVAGTVAMSATDSDLHLIRYNQADGGVIWQRNFDRPGYDYAVAMAMDSSGYIYLAGNTRSGPDTESASDASSDILSIIYDYEGTFLGALTFDGTGRQDETRDVTVNYQGEAFVAGFSTNAAGNRDYAVLKQKNDYILVPAPLIPEPQADCTKMKLTWRDNTPGTSFRLERTSWPSSPESVWTLVTTAVPGTTTFTDTALSDDNRYCYRIDAYNGSLNSRRIESCGTTTLQAPTLNALAVDSSTQISLSWNQVADNTGYKIERKVGAGSWADLATKAAGQNSHVDTGLTPGTTYYYRVSTNSVSGWSLAGNEQTAPTRPAVPTHSAPGGITTVQATLNWTNVAGETGYKIERKEGAGGTWSQIITRGADVLTYTDTGLTANTQYYYRIRAYNASGDSDYSGEQGVLTLFVSPTLSSATASSTALIDLSWTNVDGETGYTIQESTCNYNNNTSDVSYCTTGYLNNLSFWSAWSNVTTVGADTLAYQRTGRTSGYAYAYRIIANTTGNTSAPSNAIIAWTYMTAPTLSIAPASETALTPSWSNINAATNYTLERKQGAGGVWAEVAGAIGMAVNTISFTDTGLALSTEYCYRVKAYSTLPNNPPFIYSNEPCLFTPLAAPTLNAPTTAATQIDITWNNVVGNTGYELQMRTMSTSYAQYPASYWNQESAWGAWSTVATLAVDTTAHSQTGLTSGYTYQFRVRDTYSGGSSAWSNTQWTTTIPPAPTLSAPTAASTTQLNLSWNNIYGETSFKLEWKPRSGADCSAGAWGGPITIAQNTVTYNHTTLTAGTYYCYRLYAVNGAGNSGYSAERSQTTLAVPPTLDALSGVIATQVVLTWNNIAGNTGYKIERKTDAGGSWSTINTTVADAVTYTNTGLTTGTLYYYRVSTKNAAGDSSPSNEQSTTTTPAATNATATVVSAAEIDLSWPVVLGASNYKIERKEGAGGAYGEISNQSTGYSEAYCGYPYPSVSCPSLSPVTAAYQDTGLTENTLYCYRIRSWNATGGDSPASTERCATTSAMGPQNLTATAVTPFKIRLDWTPVACAPNPCDNPDGFELQRLARDGNWVPIKTFDGSTMTYTDTIAIDPNKRYSYRVRSVKNGDYSPYSNTASVSANLYESGAGTCP